MSIQDIACSALQSSVLTPIQERTINELLARSTWTEDDLNALDQLTVALLEGQVGAFK